MSGRVGRFSGRYSKNSILGATQNATRALSGHLMTGRSMIGAYANRRGARAIPSPPAMRRKLRSVSRPEPLADIAPGRLPDTLMGADMREHLVEVTDAPWLTDDPRMQMQHHRASGGGAIAVETIEPVAPQPGDLVDRAATMQVNIIVVEI